MIALKKDGILHPELARQIALLGHKHRICVADAGLPVPEGVVRIDLGYAPGQAGFISVLAALAKELVVGETLTATECSSELSSEIAVLFPDASARTVPHEQFKDQLPNMRFIVRTGEFTPYANVILTCGVPF